MRVFIMGSDLGFLRVAVFLILNLLVFCVNFSPKLNSSPRLRVSAVQLVFSGFSPCLRGGFWSLVAISIHRIADTLRPGLRAGRLRLWGIPKQDAGLHFYRLSILQVGLELPLHQG